MESDVRTQNVTANHPVRRQAAVAPTAAAAIPERNGSGKDLPPAAVENVTPAPPPPQDLSHVVESLNRYLADVQRSLHFRVDDATGRTVITVLNAETGEVVRQIPSEALLALAERLPDPGALLDEIA